MNLKNIKVTETVKSELDDIEGIGKVKKQALLRKFGSVEKIKQASIEELINVKGINRELADKIKNKETPTI